MIECILFLSDYDSPNPVELDESILLQECSTAAAHFRFQYESFENQFGVILYLFYNFQMSKVTASGNELSLKISMLYRG